MIAIVNPGIMRGVVTPPPSKSIMQRACAAALLYPGTTTILNPGSSKDDAAALNIIQQLGAGVQTLTGNRLQVFSNGVSKSAQHVHCGESGLAARLFIPVAALQQHPVTITGEGSLLTRPMTEYIDTLPLLGVHITAGNNCLPMTVRGPLQPANITIDGSASSQFLSGLMMVYAFTATEPVTIRVNNLNSRPYIDLTIQVLSAFGLEVLNHNYAAFTIHPPEFAEGLSPVIDVEADWSAAANFVVANAMGAQLSFTQLNPDSLQADIAVLSAVNDRNEPFVFDATHCPDLVPVLGVYAGYCKGESIIKGLNRLAYKESNRIVSTTSMLSALGVQHAANGDILTIHGGNGFRSCTVNAYNDHRIVMAAAVAALVADGPVTIQGAEAVSKSYPAFFDTLIAAGVNCQLVN